jgi:guanosine-3',5'-bis(diphosphate) 3'-pyrophosphohydrolase
MVGVVPRPETRRSVLPWRRHQVDVALAPLLEAYLEGHKKADTARIEAAYDVALVAHAEQVRRSGEPYISHPLGVARILADLGLDDVTIAAALLHDAVEDTELTQEQLEELFGHEVAAIVDGVTKLDRMEFESRLAQQAATMRKMLVAMANDIRVLLIKLADRLHNMRTIASLPEAKQSRIARETLDIYAPLAHRLGIGEIKWQLEDLAFAVLHPKRYAEIEQLVATRSPERDADLESVLHEIRQRLEELHIDAEVTGRPKHYWSIYEKMVVRDRDFDEIIDLLGVRVVVESVKDCYAALGSIHAWWRPVQGRFKDYIAQPKFNLYQSLHTTVVGPGGRPVEVQIRTEDMNRRAEFGVAAHWGYKESESAKSATDSAWLQRLVDWQHETQDPEQFMKILKGDLEVDEVFVFTPKGKVVILPSGSTPVDFAYAIHTEVGHRCIGARANGRLVPLDALLTTGDTVEIVTSRQEGAGPTQDWLQFAQSPRARAKIRQRFSKERREDAIDAGRDDLVIALRGEDLPVQAIMGSDLLAEVAEEMHYSDLDGFYAAIGDQHVAPRMVAQRVRQRLGGGSERLPVTARKPSRANARRRSAGVHVEGLDDMFVRLSKCCMPVPGDEIIGFMTRGRGVSVHRTDCPSAEGFSSRPDRVVEVEWDNDASGAFVVAVEVEALDRSRLLRDVAHTLAEHHVNILSCSSQTSADRVARFRFEFELADPGHLDSLIAALKRVDSVYDATRVMPGTARAVS